MMDYTNCARRMKRKSPITRSLSRALKNGREKGIGYAKDQSAIAGAAKATPYIKSDRNMLFYFSWAKVREKEKALSPETVPIEMQLKG